VQRCFFIGHREPCDSLLPKLVHLINELITAHGVDEFIVGNYGGFDRIVLKALKEIKRIHPSIRIVLLTPYQPNEPLLSDPTAIDEIMYPPDMECIPRRFAIIHANRYTIDHVDFLVVYLKHTPSNTASFVRYALRRSDLTIIFLT